MLGLVVVAGDEDIVEVDLANWDVDQLEGVDKGLVEALDFVIVGRTNDGGEGCLGLREEIFCILGDGHGADDKEGEQGLARGSSWVKKLELVKSIEERHG